MRTHIKFHYLAPGAPRPDAEALAYAGFVLHEGAALPVVGDIVTLPHELDEVEKSYRVIKRRLAYLTSEIGKPDYPTEQTLYLIVTDAEGAVPRRQPGDHGGHLQQRSEGHDAHRR
jgi:hypothetical protein